MSPSPLPSIKEYLEEEVEIAENEIIFILRKFFNSQENKIFKEIIKTIIKNNYFQIEDENNKLVDKVIEITCDQEILFYDPLKNKIIANSKIYEKAFERLLIEK